MRRAILSGLTGLALLAFGTAGCADMLTKSVPHRNDITDPVMVYSVKQKADNLVIEYNKSDKKDYSKLREAAFCYISIGNKNKAIECGNLVLEIDAISGLNILKEIQRLMP